MEPGRKSRLAVETGDGLESRDERLLDRVLSVVLATEQPACRRQHSASMAPHYRLERFFVMRFESFQQTVLVLRVVGWNECPERMVAQKL
jgi:hypothetical protein